MAKKKNDQVELISAAADGKAAAHDGSKKKPESTKKKNESSMLHRGLPGIVAGLVLIVLVQAGIYFFAGKIQQDQSAALTALYRQHFLSMLDSYSRTYEDIVRAIPDAELMQYLQPQAEPDMGLVKRVPGALFARVVPISIDPSVPNGLSFAQQDMVVRLAAGKRVTPEISFFERDTIKEQVLTYARVIKAADGTQAVALVSFPFRDIALALKNFAPDAGRIELIQKNGSDRATILSSGEGVDQPGVDASTVNPAWELKFSPSEMLGRADSESHLMLALGVFVVISVGGLLVWILVSLQRDVEADIEAVDNFSENFFRYGNRQRPLLHFFAFAPLLSHLEQYGSELRAAKGATKLPTDNLGSLEMVSNDTAILGEAPEPKVATKPVKSSPASAVPGLKPEIFRAYDVRGVVGDGLSREVAVALGRAIGSEAKNRGEQVVVVGRDGRLSGPELCEGLAEGVRASGCDVIDVGMVPTPVLYYAAKTIGSGSGVMVTGSHNPANYNGFKIMIAGDTLFGDDIQSLRERIETSNFTSGSGGFSQQNVAESYVDRVSSDIALARPVKVVVDAGNGVAGAIGPRVLEALGCTVIPLFCEVDGNFPNHHPDPSKPENLEDLMGVVAANNADIGIAFDGDGDRIGVVTAGGKNIYPDRLMMLYAKHVLTTNPGADIIFDVKCTRDLPALISSHGGRPVMCKTGHSFIKGKLKETGAALAGEMSGHIFFNDRWFGFDDAIYSAARLLEIISLEAGTSDEVFAEFPENPSTPEVNITVPDETKFALMELLKKMASFPDASVITIDGLRVEFEDSWGLIRASNTTPCLVARFEGRTPEALAAVQEKFKDLLLGADPSLAIPF